MTCAAEHSVSTLRTLIGLRSCGFHVPAFPFYFLLERH